MVLDVSAVATLVKRDAVQLKGMGVRRLALFGSCVRGGLRGDSDLDFLVDLHPKTFDNYMDVKEALESRLGRRVDLVLFSAIKPALRAAILQEAVDVALD